MISRVFNVARRTYATETISVAKPPRRIGAIKGGLFGFLLGVSITGLGSYYYLIDEYRAANKVIITDVLALEKTITNLEQHVRVLESKVK